MTWLDHISNAGKFISDGIDKFKVFKKEHKSFKDIKFKKILESENLKEYVQKTGLSIDNLADITQGGWWKHLAGVLDGQHGLLGLAEASLNIGGNISQGNYAAAGADLLEEGRKLFSQAARNKKQLTFKQGDWVFIDNGEERHTNQEKAASFWGVGVMFGDILGESDEHLSTEHVISVGFVKEPAVGDGEIDVFELETGDIRRFRIQDVEHLPPGRAATFEQNEEMKIMKDIVLSEEPTPLRVKGETPIDPGTEVTYDGKVWNVLEAMGDQVRIQSGEATVTVGVGKLQRGRTDHSNVWHYDPHQTPTGFDRDVKAGLHSGMWIWVPCRVKTERLYPSSEHELGIVRLLNGSKVDGYYCMDGERLTVEEVDIQVVAHAHDEWINSHKFFKMFRNEALVGGHSVRSYNLGQYFPRLCAGVGVQWAPVKRTPEGVEEGHIIPGKTQGELHAAAPTPAHDEIITEGDPLPVLDAAYESDRRWGAKGARTRRCVVRSQDKHWVGGDGTRDMWRGWVCLLSSLIIKCHEEVQDSRQKKESTTTWTLTLTGCWEV